VKRERGGKNSKGMEMKEKSWKSSKL
jgi:hypothetical protein